MKLKEWLGTRHPRFYFKLLLSRSYLSIPVRGSLIRRYLAGTHQPKLQLGAGRNHMSGWLNSDYFAKHPKFIYINVCHPFPLPDDVFERVYSEHMIEHIPQKSGQFMLNECFRVMKSGARIRIETPDLEKISNLYSTRDQLESHRYIQWHHQEFADKTHAPTICFAINSIMRNWDHCFLYDEEMLRQALERAGFVNIQRHSWGQTHDPEFQNISQRRGVAATEFETLAMEAAKP